MRNEIWLTGLTISLIFGLSNCFHRFECIYIQYAFFRLRCLADQSEDVGFLKGPRLDCIIINEHSTSWHQYSYSFYHNIGFTLWLQQQYVVTSKIITRCFKMKCCVNYNDMDSKSVKIPNQLQHVKSDISVKTATVLRTT